jgi:hypothetical protein
MTAPRWRQKPDANQPDIVAALESIGCSVYDASRVGGGFPDLVVGFRGLTLLLEVKTARGRLRKEQQQWIDEWRGFTRVVRSSTDAIETVLEHVKNHQSR